MTDFGDKDYIKSIHNFLKGYSWLSDFKLLGFNCEMILYIRPSDGNLDVDRANTMYLHKKKPKYQGCYLHD